MTPQYGGALRGVFLEDEYNMDVLRGISMRRILDLGANVGMASLALKAQFPEAEFVLVEPDPRNISRLKRAVAMNNMNAIVVEAAVAEHSGQQLLRFSGNPTCSALDTSQMHEHTHSVEVRCMTVGELLKEASWEWVDLVKLDIEGAEEVVLTRNNDWLSSVHALIMEIHPTCSVESITQNLSRHGLELRRHGCGHEPVYIAYRKQNSSSDSASE